MKAIDLIHIVQSELNEKREGWSEDELFVKLQRSYISLQADLPFFMVKENLDIQKDISEYSLLQAPIKDIGLKIDNRIFNYIDYDNFFLIDRTNNYSVDKKYTFDEKVLMIDFTPTVEKKLEISYRYAKVLLDKNDEIGTPLIYDDALRLRFLANIHEKPIASVDYRDLSLHYLKLYRSEVDLLKTKKKINVKNIRTKFQGV